jgi:hypothetical protein
VEKFLFESEVSFGNVTGGMRWLDSIVKCSFHREVSCVLILFAVTRIEVLMMTVLEARQAK